MVDSGWDHLGDGGTTMDLMASKSLMASKGLMAVNEFTTTTDSDVVAEFQYIGLVWGPPRGEVSLASNGSDGDAQPMGLKGYAVVCSAEKGVSMGQRGYVASVGAGGCDGREDLHAGVAVIWAKMPRID